MSFTSTYNVVSVGTSATVIMAANNERKGSIIVNNSSQTVYLGMDASVTTANGLPVAMNASMNNSGQNEVWKGNIYGIVAGTTADCRFWEWGP